MKIKLKGGPLDGEELEGNIGANSIFLERDGKTYRYETKYIGTKSVTMKFVTELVKQPEKS